MKEKFDRSVPHRNIGDLNLGSNETNEEKRLRIERTRTNINGIPMSPILNAGLNSFLDNALEELEQRKQKK